MDNPTIPMLLEAQMEEPKGRTFITEMNAMALAVLALLKVCGVEVPTEAAAPALVILNVLLRMLKKGRIL